MVYHMEVNGDSMVGRAQNTRSVENYDPDWCISDEGTEAGGVPEMSLVLPGLLLQGLQ